MTAAVMWSEVLKAMGSVDSAHSIEYWEDGEQNLDRRVTRTDTFYRRPGMWRGQGFGLVHFLTAKGERIYSVQQRRFINPAAAGMKPLNVDELKRFKDGPITDSIVEMLFGGTMPEPARVAIDSDQLKLDVELFEYKGPAKPDTVVRIWVAKASRLPIRVDLIDVQSGSDISCHIEYGAVLPESAFDADAFAAMVDQKGLKQPAEIFRAGF